MIDAEVEQRVQAHMEFQRNKEDMEKEKNLDTFIQSRKNISSKHLKVNEESTAEKNEKEMKSDHQNLSLEGKDNSNEQKAQASSDNTGEGK